MIDRLSLLSKLMNANPDQARRLLTRIRRLTAFFMFGLVVSGATAIPLETELGWLVSIFGPGSGAAGGAPPARIRPPWLNGLCAFRPRCTKPI